MMKPSDFRAFVARCKERGMSEREIAETLGCSKNSVTRWKECFSPEYIGLAVAAIEAGLPAWTRK